MPNTTKSDMREIYARFRQFWPSDVTCIYDNDPNQPQPTATWARLSMQPGAQVPASIFSNSYTQLGRVALTIFVPAQFGANPGWELSQIFIDAFRGFHNEFATLQFGTPTFGISDDEKEYFTVFGTVPYQSDH